jgi:hypothetical protein
MFVGMIALALQAAAPAPAASAPGAGRMQGLVQIYDMICNRTFPDDARIAAAMAAVPGAKPLTDAQLQGYLKDDPGQGWIIDGAGANAIVVTIEQPPIHACAVRMITPDGAIDEGMWRAANQAVQARSGGGFKPVPAKDIAVGAIRSSVIGEQKRNPDGSVEAFYLFRSSPDGPARGPEHGVEIRMVHQMAAPGATHR